MIHEVTMSDNSVINFECDTFKVDNGDLILYKDYGDTYPLASVAKKFWKYVQKRPQIKRI